MTCSQCPARNKVCEACYLHPLSNKSCGQCAGPLREYQHRLSSKSSGDDIIDVDAISAAPEDLLGFVPVFQIEMVDAGGTVEVTVHARGVFGTPVFTVPRGPPLPVQGTPRAGLAACRSPQWLLQWRVAISRSLQSS